MFVNGDVVWAVVPPPGPSHDETYQQCPFCGHEYVDEPDSNQPNLRHNMKLKKEYEEKLCNFNEA
eukprot:scaffold142170_cov67-Attheya_sp.AAC.2